MSETPDWNVVGPELLKATQSLLGCIENCEVLSGCCCCGDDMNGHGLPMVCGHEAVDSGSYYTGLAVEAVEAAIAKATGAV